MKYKQKTFKSSTRGWILNIIYFVFLCYLLQSATSGKWSIYHLLLTIPILFIIFILLNNVSQTIIIEEEVISSKSLFFRKSYRWEDIIEVKEENPADSEYSVTIFDKKAKASFFLPGISFGIEMEKRKELLALICEKAINAKITRL